MEEQVNNNPLEKNVYNNKKVLPEIVNEWKTYYLKLGHSIASTNTYYSYIKRYVGYGIEITQKSVSKFRTENTSTASASALKSLFDFLVDKKEFPQEILGIRFGKSKKQTRNITYFSEDQVTKIIDNMPSLKEKMLTKMLAECGLRISEAFKLTWKDFNWAEWLNNRQEMGSLTLRKTKGNKLRTIPVSSKLMNELYDNHQNRDSQGLPLGLLVFDYGYINYVNDNEEKEKKQVKQAEYLIYAGNRYRLILYKLTSSLFGFKGHPHMFRHYSAQRLLDKGMQLVHIKEFLGHSSIVSTQVYTQSSAEALKQEMKKLEEKNANNN